MDTGVWDEIRGKLGFARAGKPMLIGMAVILVLVAATTVHVLSGAATASDFEVSHGSGSDAVTEEMAVAKTLFVHVSGAVVKPGLYELEQGARVADAVNAAGGFAEDAAEDSCNLARVVEDGEHVIVATIAADSAGEAAGGQALVGGGAVSGLVNINVASAAELETLPGIGAATAQKIVADRTANGPFKTIDDLTRVSGIGEKKLASLAGLICV